MSLASCIPADRYAATRMSVHDVGLELELDGPAHSAPCHAYSAVGCAWVSAEAEIDARLAFVVELASAAQCAGSTSGIVGDVAAVDPRTNTAPVAPVAGADIVAIAALVDVELYTENLLAAFAT